MAHGKRVPMSNVDRAWLGMDTPVNLMMINGVLLFDEVIDFERFARLARERLVTRHERFRQRVAHENGRYYWEDDLYFDIRTHVRHVALPAPGDMATLQEFVSSHLSEELEPHRPLWRMYLVENVNGGCAVFARLHHCIADGVALVQVLLSLTDETADADLAPALPAPRSGAVAPMSSLAGVFLQPGLRLAGFGTRTLAHLARRALHEGFQTASDPRRLIELAYVGGLISTTTAAILGKLLLLPPDNPSVLRGPLGTYKRVVWSGSFDLEMVKAIGKALGATVNDVLVTVATGALRRYMLERGGAVDVRAMVPINLRSPGEELELGNQFALLYLDLPVETEAPLERLREVKRQMDLMKSSPEPLIVYELLRIIGMIPGQAADWATSWFSGKASLVLTNVPGPRGQIYFAGKALRNLMFWVPQTGSISSGMSIISYNGTVMVGLMADEGLIPDPEWAIAAFETELAALGVAAQARAVEVVGAAEEIAARSRLLPAPSPLLLPAEHSNGHSSAGQPAAAPPPM
jgi:WS/DGAT/MGAT family acyltransferase